MKCSTRYWINKKENNAVAQAKAAKNPKEISKNI
jgi:hypothetical protein